MTYSVLIKNQANKLRQEGFSFEEISVKLRIPRSTIYEWTHEIVLNPMAKMKIRQRKLEGIELSKIWWKKRKAQWLNEAIDKAEGDLKDFSVNKVNARLIAACLYWAEGSKAQNNLTFMNSDPKMISTFLTLLRHGFDLDELKFRVLIHLHEYHNRAEMIKYWSQITRIPVRQFLKVYQKPHTRKRIHPDYRGSCSIRYYDASIARELTAIYNALAIKIGL